jgi:hypothetical protein
MLIAGEKPPLLILDPGGAADGRAAKKSLARLTYPLLAAEGSRRRCRLHCQRLPGGGPDRRRRVGRRMPPRCAPAVRGRHQQSAGHGAAERQTPGCRPAQLAAQFVAPFDWELIVDRLEQLLMLATLRREHSALSTLLQLSRVELVTIDTESQSCRVNDTLAALLALPGAASAVSRRDRLQPIHWQKMFDHAMSPTASGYSTPSAAHSNRAWVLRPSTTSASIAITSGACG